MFFYAASVDCRWRRKRRGGEEESEGEEERSVLGEVEDDERKQGELRERRGQGGK